jgi:hypothetical protein
VSDKTFLVLVVSAAMAASVEASGAASKPQAAGAPAASSCERLRVLQVDKQANPRAAALNASCRQADLSQSLPKAPLAPGASSGPIVNSLLGVSDLNVITGGETYPAVTQAGSMVWGHGTTVVTVYNDTRDLPSSFSGMSVSTDGGANFTRLAPNPFAAAFTDDSGSPAVAYDASASLWLATTIVSDCGGQGIGLMTSATPSDAASWTAAPCPHSGVADDRPILWVDDNPASPYYARRYVAFNDFNAGGALKLVYFAAAAWHEVVVDAAFIRNVHLTGSSGTDGTVFIFAMNEGGGAGDSRTNRVYRSLNGGVTWTSVSPGPSFPPAGAGLCAASDYFYMVPPLWRTMGWGQGAVGPNGVVHYVYGRAGQVPGDLGDIYYTRSTDNGASWSSPAPLNSDQLDQNNVVQWEPSISVTSQGYVLAAWYDRRDTTDGLNYRYFGRLSLDNGATFLPEEPISDIDIPQPYQPDSSTDSCFAGDSNFHAALGNQSLVTWTDGRNALSDGSSDVPQMDVYFDRVSLCPTITVSPASLPKGQATVAYSQSVTAAGGTGPYTFALAGALPDGLGLNSGTGAVTGSPTAAGITPFAIVATDSLGCTGSRDYSLVVDPPPATTCPTITIAPPTLPGTTQGAPYSATVTASGGAAPYAYTVTAGALPEGLALDAATGQITGTAVESGSSSFAITATDANQCTGTRAYSPSVACPTITLSPDRQLPDAYVGVPYLTRVTANGGTAPYTYKVVQGQIHTGLFTTSGGAVYGVTEGPGSKIFRMRATDANGCTGEAQFRTDSVSCFPGDVLCDDMTDPTVNFTAADQCGGGAEWYGTSACLSSNDIGHSASAHARWGTNGACGDYGSVATQDSLTSTSLNVSNCNSGEVILQFNYLLSFEDDNSKDRARVEVAADGAAPVVVADNGAGGPTCSGNASPGIGNLTRWSGWQHLELTHPATSTFQVSFVGETDDGTRNSGEGFFVDDVLVRCKCPVDLMMTPEVLANAIVNTAYTQTIAMVGGAPPYTYSTLPGSPTPAGLSLDPVTGVLSGTPTAPGIYPFTIVATDSNFCKVSILYNLIVSPQGCPAMTFTPESMSTGVTGVFYSEVVAASGGVAPYSYRRTAGRLPSGLALDPDSGVISGTPDTPGISQFTITGVDANFCVGSADYSVIVNPPGCPTIDISPTALPNASRGVDYSQTLTASGGVAPYTWSVAHGHLPAGLTLDPAAGTISGMPITSDVFSFAVAAQDANGCYGARSYGLEVIYVGALFFTLDPCRVVDTRRPNGPLGGPMLVAGAERTFTLAGACSIPATAKALSVNVAVTQPTAAGNLRLYPAGAAVPGVSAINYSAGQTRANNGVVPLNDSGQAAVFVGGSGNVHMILDVNGYFE